MTIADIDLQSYDLFRLYSRNTVLNRIIRNSTVFVYVSNIEPNTKAVYFQSNRFLLKKRESNVYKTYRYCKSNHTIFSISIRKQTTQTETRTPSPWDEDALA